MYDIHCHLLPGIDDGSPSMQYSLDMARYAVDHGTTHMVVTPHIHPGRYDNERRNITRVCQEFKMVLEKAAIPLKLGVAAEVRLSAEILTLIRDRKIPFLGQADGVATMLLELPHGRVPPGCENLVEWLRRRACRAMIAHPERNKGIMRDPELLDPFIELGCLVQITAGSLVGKFGDRVREIAEQLLLDGKVDVIASDSHNLTHRTPDLGEGFRRALELVGPVAATKLVIDNPKKITASQFR